MSSLLCNWIDLPSPLAHHQNRAPQETLLTFLFAEVRALASAAAAKAGA
jgi:hypothetical protein